MANKPNPTKAEFPTLRKKEKVKNYGVISGTDLDKKYPVAVKAKKSGHSWTGTITAKLDTGGYLAEVFWVPRKDDGSRTADTITVTVTNTDPAPQSGDTAGTDDSDVVP